VKQRKNCPEDCTGGSDGEDLDTSGDSYTVGNPSCYSYMGAKWNTVEPYLIKTKNREGLDAELIKQAFEYAIGEWEDAASGVINDSASIDIIGSRTNGKVNGIDDGMFPDGKNEVLFGSFSEPGVIAVTIT